MSSLDHQCTESSIVTSLSVHIHIWSVMAWVLPCPDPIGQSSMVNLSLAGGGGGEDTELGDLDASTLMLSNWLVVQATHWIIIRVVFVNSSRSSKNMFDTVANWPKHIYKHQWKTICCEMYAAWIRRWMEQLWKNTKQCFKCDIYLFVLQLFIHCVVSLYHNTRCPFSCLSWRHRLSQSIIIPPSTGSSAAVKH